MINALASGQGKKSDDHIAPPAGNRRSQPDFLPGSAPVSVVDPGAGNYRRGGVERVRSWPKKLPLFPGPPKASINRRAVFSMPQLSTIYHRLQEMDVAFKRSQITPELALDILITELALK